MRNFFKNIFRSNTVVNTVIGSNKTQITGNPSGTCTINGKTFNGNNISIIDGEVYINGKIADKSNATGSGTNEYIKTIIGNNGVKFNIDVLNDIKNNLMNIDLMIINELNDLFMQIF